MTTSKHPYNPGWSWGNAITIIVFVLTSLASAAGIYTLLRVDIATAAERVVSLDGKVVTLDGKIAAVEDRGDAAIGELKVKVEKLDDKMDIVVEQQAQTKATLDMILREMRRR
jgi:hypothetical protein